jgi:RNA polymerase sigma-70 factor (ECF subfamily)
MSPAHPSLSVETLLADAGWVRRLAARLVADPGSADELAQETLVAAWRHPPAHGTPSRPWLARVLRNFARQKSRAQAARDAHERRQARGPSAPDDLLERAELAQRLARLVLELDEPYRTTVLQRFFEGWSAEQIARASGTNPSTVRTRLERALAQLRSKLERERGRDWIAALAPLAKISGGIAVGTGAKLGVGVCLAALCGWLFWPRAAPLAPALEPPVTESAGTRTPLDGPVASVTTARVPAAGEKVAPAAQKVIPTIIPPGTIEGLVVRRHGESELGIEGARVMLWPMGSAAADSPLPVSTPQAEVTSKSDGSFRFAKLEPGEYRLAAQPRNGPRRESRASVPDKGPGAQAKIVFGSTRIHGQVHDERGEPLAGVPIRIEGGHELQFVLRAESKSGEHGEYAIEELPAGVYMGSVTHHWESAWPGRLWYLTLLDGDDLQLDMGAPRALPHWRGTVRTSLGEPVKSGGTLHLERDEATALGSTAKTYREVHFDESARFDVALEPGSWWPGVSLASKPETRRKFEQRRIGKEDLEHDLVLPGTRLSGTVYDSVTLQPLAGLAGVLQVSISRPGPKFPSAFTSVDIDAGGHFAIDMIEPGAWELSTHPLKVAAGGAKLDFKIAPGQTELQLDVQVQRP